MSKTKEKIKIAVYGSLKRGFGNHFFLQKSRFLTTTNTKDSIFMLNSFGAFPAVTKNGKFKIQVEIYEINKKTLNTLDDLEGNGIFYKREIFEFEDGAKAWMYCLLNEKHKFLPNHYGVYITEDKTTLVWGGNDLPL